MAVSKIWALHQTVGKAIKYICNYEKTADGTLITSYKCTEQFAEYEFRDIASKARRVKNPRIGYHSIISFSPEDSITPSKALELGKRIMDEYTKGKYQYVLSVHTDQEHIHVHCIMNSVGLDDYKKLQISDKDLDKLEKLTDKVCRENNLSVIEQKSGIKGKRKYEYEKHLNGDSWKDKLREIIDNNILEAQSFDDFIQRMQMENGCEIKIGKYLSFRLPGQERFTRNRSLGDAYSIENITERILNKDKIQAHLQEQDSTKSVQDDKIQSQTFFQDGNISLDNKISGIIDVAKNSKAQKYSAYRKKLNLININSYAGMMSFVRRYHIVYKEDFDNAKTELEEKNNDLTAEIRKKYSELNRLEADSHQIEKYLDNIDAHKRYHTTIDKNEKYDLSDANRNYESALYYIKKNDIKKSQVTPENLSNIKAKIEILSQEIEGLKEERKKVRGDIRQLDIIQKNNEKIFHEDMSKSAMPDNAIQMQKHQQRR